MLASTIVLPMPYPPAIAVLTYMERQEVRHRLCGWSTQYGIASDRVTAAYMAARLAYATA